MHGLLDKTWISSMIIIPLFLFLMFGNLKTIVTEKNIKQKIKETFFNLMFDRQN